MNQVLIICLKKFGDVFSAGHLANSIKKERPTTEITLLVYKESEKAALRLRNVRRVVTIDRKKILSIKGSPLFNNAHSANEFFKTIDPLSIIDWEMIVNFSNDPVATYLTSYFNSENKSGVSFNMDRSTKYSNTWAKFYNELAADKENSYFNFLEFQHAMSEVPWSTKGEKVILNDQNNKIVQKKFNEIRSKYTGDIKIIGIQLKTADVSKDIPRHLVREVIYNFIKSNQYYPVLLTSPAEEEKAYAKEIVDSIDEDIISIETDFKALPSVLLYLDALITPDTAIKHVADLVETPILEVSCGASPLFKQSTVGEDNIILRPSKGDRNQITYKDIEHGLKILLSGEHRPNLDTECTFYISKKDGNRMEYLPLAGSINFRMELRRLLGREFILSMVNQTEADFSLIIKFFSLKERQQFRSSEKEEIVESLKALLGAIRAISMAKMDKKKIGFFVESLDRVLQRADLPTSASLPFRLFRAELESLSGATFLDNLNKIEQELFNLKANVKTYSSMLDKMIQTEKGSQKVRQPVQTI